MSALASASAGILWALALLAKFTVALALTYLGWYFLILGRNVHFHASTSLVGTFRHSPRSRDTSPTRRQSSSSSKSSKTTKSKDSKVDTLASLVKTHCPTIRAGFKPCISLPWGHTQTIYSSLYAEKWPEKVNYERELVVLPDGGTVSMDWAVNPVLKVEDGKVPTTMHDEEVAIAVILHGLTGGSQESYVKALATEFMAHGYKVVCFNSRGCAGTKLTSPQLYTGAYTKDLDHLLKKVVRPRFPKAKIVGTGCSLGANVITKYTGEQRDECVFSAVASLANPFDFLLSSRALQNSYLGRKVYSPAMAYALKRLVKRHIHMFEDFHLEFDKVLSARFIHDFDNHATSKLFRFRSADEYYRNASSSVEIPDIRTPTLLLNSDDDPIAMRIAYPYGDVESNPFTVLVHTQRGGHLGWFGDRPVGKTRQRRWFPAAVTEFFNMALDIEPVEVQCSFTRAERGTPIKRDTLIYKDALDPKNN